MGLCVKSGHAFARSEKLAAGLYAHTRHTSQKSRLELDVEARRGRTNRSSLGTGRNTMSWTGPERPSDPEGKRWKSIREQEQDFEGMELAQTAGQALALPAVDWSGQKKPLKQRPEQLLLVSEASAPNL
jgi:hypothetical protein